MKTTRLLVLVSLLVAAAWPAVIHAASATAFVGQSVTVSVASDGTPPFTYQWNKNGAPIAGATAATLVLASVQIADAGTYTVRVANVSGAIVSDNATLAVAPAPPTTATTAFTVAAKMTTAAPLKAAAK